MMAEVRKGYLTRRCDYCYELRHLAIVPISEHISMELCSYCTNKYFRSKEDGM